MITIPISEMSKLRLRGLEREGFSVLDLSMNLQAVWSKWGGGVCHEGGVGGWGREQQREDDRGYN